MSTFEEMLAQRKQQYNKNISPTMKRMAKIFKKQNKPYKLLNEQVQHVGWSLACENVQHLLEFEEFLLSLSSCENTISTDQNWTAPDLALAINPETRQNPVSSEFVNRVYNTTAQRSAGKGEILVSLLCGDAEKTIVKHADVCIRNKNIELKADIGTIHQEEENKFRQYDKLLKETFNLKPKEIKEAYKTYHPLPTLLLNGKDAANFYSKLYRNWSSDKLDIIEKIWNEFEDPDIRSQELGYLVLCDYVSHKNIDGILLTEQQKDGKIKAVYITDLTDKKFIFENITMKPQKMRSGSTEARPDGLVNISISMK